MKINQSMIRVCERCGAEEFGNANFCSTCGHVRRDEKKKNTQNNEPIPVRAPNTRKCMTCGNYVDVTLSSCPKCKTNMDGGKTKRVLAKSESKHLGKIKHARNFAILGLVLDIFTYTVIFGIFCGMIARLILEEEDKSVEKKKAHDLAITAITIGIIEVVLLFLLIVFFDVDIF